MKISPRTFTFLKGIKKNNNRHWFAKHKEEYKELHKQFQDFAFELGKEIIKFDSRVKSGFGHKKTIKVFRIYRDARFSKDKTPYKTNFGMSIAPGGMIEGNPGYYLHISPGENFVGGGLYMPEAKALRNVRETIAKNPNKLRKILADKSFKKMFGSLGDYSILKTAPRDYSIDHPAIDLLRYKSFTVGREFSDKEVISKDFGKKVITTFKTLKPLNDYLAKAILED